jgi:hypothetical protein
MSKAERKWRQRQRQKQREEGPPPGANESDFARRRWTGLSSYLDFIALHDLPQFQGIGKTGVVLPPNRYSVSRTPTVGIMAMEVYPHGLSYASPAFEAGGLGTFAWLLAAVPMGYLMLLEPLASWGIFDAVLLLVGLITLYFCVRFDTFGYRYDPVLFNRALGLVHVFKSQATLWNFKHLFGSGGYSISTFAWSCVRAQMSSYEIEVHNYHLGWSARPVVGQAVRLDCLVFESPDRPLVVARFPLDVHAAGEDLQLLLDHWEHIRRYMEHEGPMFVEGEGPYEQPTTQSLLGAVFFGQPFIGPGWREQYDSADLPTMIWQGVSPFFFPITMLLGLCRWTSYHLRSEPKWPAEILSSVGGAALKKDELEAWRGVIPERPKRIEASDKPMLKNN